MTEATTLPTDLALEASSGNRVSVSWTEPRGRVWFLAAIDGGDRMGQVEHGGASRRAPTIYIKGEGRGGIRYESAEATEWSPLVDAIREHVNRKGLVKAAVQQKAEATARREAQQVADKAKCMRENLARLLSRPGREALAGVQDKDLAEAYDRIQNTVW